MTDIQPVNVRLDLWLWATRFYKTRALAKQAIDTGKVEINGQRPKPSRPVSIGDALRIQRGVETFEIRVRGLIEKRVAYNVAALMYEESDDSIKQREIARAQQRAQATGYRAPETKPDKRARRLIKALGDIEML